MNITVVCVGTLRESYFRDAFAEYQKRIGAYARCTVRELAEQRLPQAPSDAEIAQALQREGALMLSETPKRAFRIALCVEGKQLSSEALAEKLGDVTAHGCSDIVCYIGSSYGLCDAVKAAADLRLSFSPMTFPHQLMRVLLAEQLYRALSIQNHGKYHK